MMILIVYIEVSDLDIDILLQVGPVIRCYHQARQTYGLRTGGWGR